MDIHESIYIRILSIITDVTKNHPHEQKHLFDTREKLYVLTNDPPIYLQIAAIGHDIDRSIPERTVKRKEFNDYEQYKKAHANESAKIMQEILESLGSEPYFIAKVVQLIEEHERYSNENEEQNILMTADSLSFFTCNILSYELTHSIEDTRKKISFMYDRMLPRGKEYIKTHHGDIYQKYVSSF